MKPIMTLRDWKDKAKRGTSGDMVDDILRDWALDVEGEFNIQVFKDGNQWCAMIGPNLQEGIAGFGDVPSEAVVRLTHHEAFSEWSNNLH